MASVRDKAVLAQLIIHKWSANKRDKRASAEVAENHGATERAVRANKTLIDPKWLAEITAAESAARTYFYKMTTPWSLEGHGLLSTVNYLDFMAEMRRLGKNYNTAADKFEERYDEAREHQRGELGDLFNELDYPSARTIRAKFHFDCAISKIPDAVDFRCDLSEAENERIRQDIEERYNAALRETVDDLFARIYKVVSEMIERIKNYRKTDDGVEGIFRDSAINNIRDLITLLPSLNVTGDPELTAMAARVDAELCAADADDLRQDDVLRNRVLAEADAILSQLGGYAPAMEMKDAA